MKEDWVYQLKNIKQEHNSELLSVYPESNTEYSLKYFCEDSVLSKIVKADQKELKHYNHYVSNDPLGDKMYEKFPNVLHKYKDRILILTSTNCFFYCRYCNRKRDWKKKSNIFDTLLLPKIEEYTRKNNIVEVILSGGDPLTLSNNMLKTIISTIHSWKHIISIRIHTRAITSMPFRFFDEEFLSILKNYSDKIWIYSHIVHKNEINEHVKKAVKNINHCGISVFNQNPVLKGINDSAKVLKELFYSLISVKIVPKYIYQLDIAIGTTHFMVEPKKILDMIKELQGNLSGLAMPRFIVDLPDGKGKVPISNNYLVSHENSKYVFKNIDGVLVEYYVD